MLKVVFVRIEGKIRFNSPFITGRLIVLCTKTSMVWSLLRSAKFETIAKLKKDKTCIKIEVPGVKFGWDSPDLILILFRWNV